MTATVLHLPTARSLALLDVARLTDSRTYARGVQYLHRGAVEICDRFDDAVSAVVVGSTTYAVRLSIGRRGVEHLCTCPVGSDGGFCKHLVAVALAAADDGDDDDHDDADDEDATDEDATWEAAAHRLLDEVDALLAAGRVTQVIELCERAAAFLDRSAVDLPDDGDDLHNLADRLRAIRVQALTRPSTARPERRATAHPTLLSL